MIRDYWTDPTDGTIVFFDSVVRVHVEKRRVDDPSTPGYMWVVIADLAGGHDHVVERYPIPTYGDQQTREYAKQEAEWGRNRFAMLVAGWQS